MSQHSEENNYKEWEEFLAQREAKPKSKQKCENCPRILTLEEMERVGNDVPADEIMCEICDLQMYGDG